MEKLFFLISIFTFITSTFVAQPVTGLIVCLRSSTSDEPLGFAKTGTNGGVNFSLPQGNYVIYLLRNNEIKNSMAGKTNFIKTGNTLLGDKKLKSFVVGFYLPTGIQQTYISDYLIRTEELIMANETQNVSVNGSTTLNGEVGIASSEPMKYSNSGQNGDRMDIFKISVSKGKIFEFSLVFKSGIQSDADKLKSKLHDKEGYGAIEK